MHDHHFFIGDDTQNTLKNAKGKHQENRHEIDLNLSCICDILDHLNG